MKELSISPIRTLREHRGLSLAELAEQTGISERMLRYIENGQSAPTLPKAQLIADALGCSLDDLVTEPAA